MSSLATALPLAASALAGEVGMPPTRRHRPERSHASDLSTFPIMVIPPSTADDRGGVGFGAGPEIAKPSRVVWSRNSGSTPTARVDLGVSLPNNAIPVAPASVPSARPPVAPAPSSASPAGGAATPAPAPLAIRPMTQAPLAGPIAMDNASPTSTDVGTGTGRGFSGSPITMSSGSSTENMPPVAQDDTIASAFGTPYAAGSVNLNVLTNDSDPNNDPISVSSVTQPAHGTVTDLGGGTLKYVTNDITNPGGFQPYVGPDSFTYTIEDGRRGQATGTVRINGLYLVKVDLTFRDSGTITKDPENSCYPTAKADSGTDLLGPLPIGTGREDIPFKGNSYINQYEVVGVVNPDGAKTLPYAWDVDISFRSWFVKSNGTEWTVTQRSRGGVPPDGPLDDSPIPDYYDATPDQTSQKIFMVDPSGVTLSGQPVSVGDYIRVEKQFVYSVLANGNKAGELKMTQVIVAKKKANTGVVANDWDGITNIYQSGTIDLTTGVTEIRGIVQGNLPIQIDAHAND